MVLFIKVTHFHKISGKSIYKALNIRKNFMQIKLNKALQVISIPILLTLRIKEGGFINGK